MKSPNRQFKDAIYEQFSRIGKAVSSPKRLELLDLLCQGEKTVETLTYPRNRPDPGQRFPAPSGPSSGPSGRSGERRLVRQIPSCGPDGLPVFRSMRVLAENRLAEVELINRRFLEGREGMEPVDRNDLLKRVKDGAVTVLDVRPAEEYRAGHIPGALSVPLGQLKELLSKLPKDQEIVAYCRGPYCVLAVQAVEMLRKKGFKAIRLEEGIQDWMAMGLSISFGEEKTPVNEDTNS